MDKKIKHKNEETVLVNIASFNGIEDFLSQIPPQEQKNLKYSIWGITNPTLQRIIKITRQTLIASHIMNAALR